MTTLAPELTETRAWVDRAVIGLNLCPFAKAPQAKGLVRYVLSDAADTDALFTALCDELQTLAAAEPASIETTLLIHPKVLTDFDDYNDFLDMADAAVDVLGLAGQFQIASFHPHYRFDGTAEDDLSNATNRSPYPMLQLLREDSVTTAVDAFPDPAHIYERNVATLEALGADGWRELQAACRRDAGI